MERTQLAKTIIDLVKDTTNWSLTPIGYDAGIFNGVDYAPSRRFTGDENHVALFYNDSPKKNPYQTVPKPKPDPRLRVQAVGLLVVTCVRRLLIRSSHSDKSRS